MLDDERLERSRGRREQRDEPRAWAGGREQLRVVRAALRRAGVHYDARRRLVVCDGRRVLDLGAASLGADDRAGPNATGQPAVDSYYAASVELSITNR